MYKPPPEPKTTFEENVQFTSFILDTFYKSARIDPPSNYA